MTAWPHFLINTLWQMSGREGRVESEGGTTVVTKVMVEGERHSTLSPDSWLKGPLQRGPLPHFPALL